MRKQKNSSFTYEIDGQVIEVTEVRRNDAIKNTFYKAAKEQRKNCGKIAKSRAIAGLDGDKLREGK